eukprot:4044341-Pleurochrysis_carterae.AAC.1
MRESARPSGCMNSSRETMLARELRACADAHARACERVRERASKRACEAEQRARSSVREAMAAESHRAPYLIAPPFPFAGSAAASVSG